METVREQNRRDVVRRDATRRDIDRRDTDRRDTDRRDTDRRDTDRRDTDRRDTNRRDTDRRDTNKREADRRKYKKRKNRARRNREKRNRRLLVAAIFMGCTLAGCMLFFHLFRVTNIKVAGNTRYTDEVIIQYVQEDMLTSNTMLVTWFRKHIDVEEIPFVESIDIEALDNNTIRIYVNEKQIVGYVVQGYDKLYFDKDGYILEAISMTDDEVQNLQSTRDELEALRLEEEGVTLPQTGEPDGEDGLNGNENQDGENQDGENLDGENLDGENLNEENLNEENLNGEDPSEENLEAENQEGTLDADGEALEEELDYEEELLARENGMDEIYEAAVPNVPRILGVKMENLALDQQIQVENASIFNTILGIWRMTSKYEIIPEIIFFDEEYNITLVYQEGTILCQLGQDTILEEKITRVAPILPNLEDKTGILHLEEYSLNTESVIFSQESEYTVKSKIYAFL